MGAGSAKGINSSAEDDGDLENDRFSVISHEDKAKEPVIPLPKSSKRKSISGSVASLGLSDDESPPTESSSVKKEEKKRGLFGFWKDDDEAKTSAFVHEEDPKSRKSFKLFGWKKEEKKEEKDEALDQEINDLHRTFDSLGIEAKTSWNDNDAQPKSQSADDIRKLSPMRNRVHVKPRTLRTSHSRRNNNNDSLNNSGQRNFNDSLNNSGQRNFKYSWETEHEVAGPVPDEDNWSYKAVVIDGFDIEKFKRANFEDTTIASTIPNSVINDPSPPISPKVSGSPLTYDQTEQKLLSTIERDFAF